MAWEIKKRTLQIVTPITKAYVTPGHWDSSRLTVFTLKLLLNQIAVSLGETFPGPNGFNKTPSSSYLSCCNNLALNSSNPSKASALCRNDEVSNCRRRMSEEAWLDAPAVAFWSEELLLTSALSRNVFSLIPCHESVNRCLAEALSQIWTVHLSFMIERSPQGVEPEEPLAEVGVI